MYDVVNTENLSKETLIDLKNAFNNLTDEQKETINNYIIAVNDCMRMGEDFSKKVTEVIDIGYTGADEKREKWKRAFDRMVEDGAVSQDIIDYVNSILNQEIEDKKDAENKYDSTVGENPGVDYTGQLNQIMSGIMSGQTSSSGWVSNGTSENVYLQWLQNYSSDGKASYTGSTFESSAYFEYLQLARKNEAIVDKYNVGSERSIQYNLGKGYQDTGIITTDNGYISGLDTENLYEIIARAIDCDIEVSALGVSIKNDEGATATALKTSIYKTSDVISTLKGFGVDIAVRLSRTSGNFSLTEYVEGLPVEEQVVTIQFDDDKSATIKAYVKDSVVLLDAKSVADAVGGNCSISGSSVNISRENSYFRGTIDSSSFSLSSKGSNIGGGNYKLSCPILNIDGTVFVSTYSLIKGLGYDAFWDTGVHILYLL
mgnify:CR=1 FL=1